MKKKLFAALAAMMLLGTAMAAPVSAEETYRKGDVNMDGEITAEDAQLVLWEYTAAMLGLGCSLTEEQLELASISGSTVKDYKTKKILPFSCYDAQVILHYYLETRLVEKLPVNYPMEDYIARW